MGRIIPDMYRISLLLILIVLTVLLSGPEPRLAPAVEASPACAPTRPDALGPFYKANAPLRAKVGSGHVLKGVVRSAPGCGPIAGARLEFWLAGPNGQYDDDHRATVLADAAGAYRFESNYPPPYAGRPSHIHARVSAERHQTLVTQYYPPPNSTEGTFDLVLTPLR